MRQRLPWVLLALTILIAPAPVAEPENVGYFQFNNLEPPAAVMLSQAPGLFEGTGASQRVYFDGLTNSYATSSIDHSTSTTVYADAPSGWSYSDQSLEITDLSAWFDVPILNPSLDDWHIEKWIVTPTYNDDDVPIPDSWTFVKTEAPPGTGRVAHPRHGMFEIDWDSGLGYLGATGCRLEAKWGSSDEIYQDEIYLSQQVSIPRKDVRSVEVRLLYKVADYQGDTVSMTNQTHLFIRFAGYEGRFYVFEPGDSLDTWLEAKLTIPSSVFASYDGPQTFLLDTGMGSQIDGETGVSGYSFLWIDEIRVRTLAEPYPDQVNLLANGTAVSGLTRSSISPYVPDGANRDCFSSPTAGIDLNGYNDNGLLFSGLHGTTWADSYRVQVGLQFPLDIPQGAVIDSAILEVEAGTGSNFESGLTTQILVADEDTVSAFTGGMPDLLDRFDWVNTSIDWSFTNWVTHDRYNSPDIGTLIQKTVSRAGWQSGNYICIMLDYTYSSTFQRWIDIKGSSNYFTTDLARLFIDYSVPHEYTLENPFSYRKQITIDTNKVHGDLVDFPVMLDIYDSDLRWEVQPGGDDIRFVSQGQSLDYEIQEFNQAFNSTHAHLVAWVRVPFLSSIRDTTITMWYGNDALSSGEYPDGVWRNGYSAIWHMEENPGGAFPQILDSTQPQSDGTTAGSMSASDLVPGISGGAIDLDGSDDYIDFGFPSELQITGAMTVEAWFRADVIGNDYLISRIGDAGSRGWDISFDPGAWEVPSIDPDGILMCRHWDSGQTGYSLGWERINISEWYHVAFVFEPSVYTRIFINGQMVAEDRVGVSSDLANPSGIPIRIGTREPAGNYFNATVDETRISNVRRSPEWFATQYNNMIDPDEFFSIEAEPLVYKYKKDIAIDHTKVSADLSGFPVLIEIIDTDLKFKAQDDGDDIVFRADEVPLSHEIELFDKGYNSTHARLVAWVKTDISSTVDTVVTMYYGNALVGNQERPHSVWSDGYWGVWHLGETGGAALDSTSLGNDGTVLGGPSRGVAGPVGHAYEFDGADDYVYLANQNTQSTGTYSFWFYPHNIVDEINIIAYDAYRNRIAMYNARIRPETATESEYFYFTLSSIVQDAWQHVVFIRSGDSGDLYINGTFIQHVVETGADTITVDSIGGTVDIDRMFDGPIDEVRISTIARTGDWAITEFNNQKDPASFISVGEENLAVSFDYKKEITIDHNKVAADLSDFPVLIDIFDSDLKTKVQSDGDDIVFKAGNVLLPHEIELYDNLYNSTHAHLVTWVKTDLSSTIDTSITMYYGNPHVNIEEDPGGVWDSYVGVWHLDESPTGTVYDSSQYKNHGTTIGSMSPSDLVACQIGQGFAMDGIDDTINITESSSLDSVAEDGTLSVWVSWVNPGDGYQRILTTSNRFVLNPSPPPTLLHNDGFEWAVQPDRDLFFYPWGGNQSSYNEVDDPFANLTWHHVALTLEWSTKTVQIFVDGISMPFTTEQVPTGWTQLANLEDWLWGGNQVADDDEMYGWFDEIRVSNVVRPSGWILTEFNNQHDTSSFYSVGDENLAVSFDYKKEIAIDHTKVSGDLDGFPVLIDIFDSDLKFKAQPDGDDIIFTMGDTLLAHEIELFDQTFNSSHAHLIAWVKADLSSTSDTILTMYYGNPIASNQENAAGVWGTSYSGVWHLKEDPTGTIYDSTFNSNHGTGYNLQSDDQVDGQIDGSIDFDNVQDYIDCGNDSSLNVGSNDFSLSLWFKYDGVDNGVLAGKGAVLMGKRYLISIDTVAGYLWAGIDDDNEVKWVYSSTTYGDNLWHHVSLVRDGNNLRLYIDGVEDPNSPTDITGYGSLDQIQSFYMNTFCSDTQGTLGYWSTANTDEVRVANFASSPAWIATEYSNQQYPASFVSVGDESLAVSFDYKKEIVVDHNEVSADLTEFPLLVDIYDTDLRTKVQPTGDDIVFMSGGVMLSHEIEFFDQAYNSTHAHLVAWVSTDLSASIDTVITMYYGNPFVKSLENPVGAWNTAYSAVWHLSEDPSGTVFDSTVNSNDGGGFPLGSEPNLTSGKIYYSSEFHGTASNERIEFPHNSTLALASDMTVEAWVRTSNTDGSSDVIVSKWGDVGHRNYWLGKLDDTTLAFYVDNTQGVAASYSLVNDGFWHHVVGVASSSSSLLLLYVDGIQRNSAPYSGSTQTGSSVLHIGNNPGSVGFIQEWDGRIDEVRVSSSVRSPDWILTEYKNQFNPSSFFSVGAEQTGQEAEVGEAHSVTYILTTNHTSAVQIQTKISMQVHSTSSSLTDDFVEGTKFTITNGTQGLWTAYVLLSPPAEVSEIGFSLEYPVHEWNPTAVISPLGSSKTLYTDWAFGDGTVMVFPAAVDSTGLWTLSFEDNNHVFDLEMGLQGGPLFDSDTFSVGDTVQFRPWATGLGASLVELYLTDSTGSLWYYNTAAIQGTGYPVPFNHKKDIVIDSMKVESNLTDFPVLIELYDTDLRVDVQTDGDDITFVSGTQVLAHEIEVFNKAFNSTHAHLIAWVKVPFLSGSVDTTISMYYGNSEAIAK
ncbi:MAG: DUF2341 domain-containing protein, partial [Candidatus Thorarchaeota archaeon]